MMVTHAQATRTYHVCFCFFNYTFAHSSSYFHIQTWHLHFHFHLLLFAEKRSEWDFVFLLFFTLFTLILHIWKCVIFQYHLMTNILCLKDCSALQNYGNCSRGSKVLLKRPNETDFNWLLHSFKWFQWFQLTFAQTLESFICVCALGSHYHVDFPREFSYLAKFQMEERNGNSIGGKHKQCCCWEFLFFKSASHNSNNSVW